MKRASEQGAEADRSPGGLLPLSSALSLNDMKMRILYLAFFATVILFPTWAFAEVSDKMPSVARIWIQGGIVGAVGFFIARYRLWAGLVFGLVTIFFCIGTYGLISDPFVGPAIKAEQGNPYLFAVYGSIILVSVPLIAGLYARRKESRKRHGKNAT
jgi:hypothetical protein